MTATEYQQRIVDYYRETENAYKDSWDLGKSMAIHYGYWDKKVSSFPQSLQRMNEVMMEAAAISQGDKILDAGCGVGGSAIFLAITKGCQVTGITLSERQLESAMINADRHGVVPLVDFKIMDYMATTFPEGSFDVVWGCESICYADSKDKFIREAFRLLKPGGRLVVADGFVTRFENNDQRVIRQWLDGWQVNYLESPERFSSFMQEAGFADVHYRDITKEAYRSSQRLNRIYYLASLYLAWKKISFSRPATGMQKKNIRACHLQYTGMKKGLWQYGLLTGKKQG